MGILIWYCSGGFIAFQELFNYLNNMYFGSEIKRLKPSLHEMFMQNFCRNFLCEAIYLNNRLT
jgi:hypothetical protein